MCEWGTTIEVLLPVGGWNGTGRPRRSGSFAVPIDSCIADLVKALNDGGIITRDSCCGHGKAPGMIRLMDGRALIVETKKCWKGCTGVTTDAYGAPWPSVSLVWPKPRTWRYLRDYSVEWTAEGFPRQRLTVPAAFECDGASEPAVVEWYLGRDLILREAGFHDLIFAYRGDLPPELHLYDDGGVWRPAYTTWSRRDADRLFARLLAMNVWIRDDQRRNAYRMVRLFGWRAWQRERPRPTVLSEAT